MHYLYYSPSMQERAMQLMGSKLEASLAIEGNLSEEGLLAMTQGEDMTTAMAKALVEGLHGEGVEEIWSKLNRGNSTGHTEGNTLDGTLFYVDPGSLLKKRRTRLYANSQSGNVQFRLKQNRRFMPHTSLTR